MIIVVMGLPGTGKSYFAERLAEMVNGVYISSDRVRKEMLAHRTYTPEEKDKVYTEMTVRMRQAIAQQRNVVMDATYFKQAVRDELIEGAAPEKDIFFIEIKAAEQLVKERLQQRRTDSEADYGVYRSIQAQWEPVRGSHLELESTDSNIDDMLARALDHLGWNNKLRS